MARSTPTDKLEFVRNLRALSEVVEVITYAPGYESDIGSDMGIAVTKVVDDQDDVIVKDFATVVKIAKWGRSVYVNSQKFVQFKLTAEIVALMINLLSSCIIGSTPFNAVQLIWVSLIVDTLGVLALATEPPIDELMYKPPVKLTEKFITNTMWRNIIGQSVYQMVVLFCLTYAGIVPIVNLQGRNAADILHTFIFNTFIFCQVFNKLNSRYMDEINIFRGLLKSGVLITIMLSIILQILIVEFLGNFASTVPLDWELWLLSIGIGFVSMPIAGVLKFIHVGKIEVGKHHDGYERLPTGIDYV